MASPRARSTPFSFILEWLFTQLHGRPPVRDAFLCTRNGESDQRNVHVAEACDAGLEEDDAKEAETRCQSCPEWRSQQHGHECILQLNTAEFIRRPSGEPADQPCFVLDSGAYHHVVGDTSPLSSFRTVTHPAGGSAAAAAYRARDGRRLAVAGVGTVSLDGFHLSDVLHVPGLPVGVVLVSVTQLAERGYLVMFGGGRCHVKDQNTGDMVGNGRLHSQDGLYHLEFLKIPPDTTDTTAP